MLCANCSDVDLSAILKGDHQGIPLRFGHEVWITRKSDSTVIWVWDLQPGCEFCEFISAAQIHLLPQDASKRPRYLQLDCGKSYYRVQERLGPSTKLSSHVNIIFDSPDGRPEDQKFRFSYPNDIVSFSVPTDVEMPDLQPSPLQVNEIPVWLDLDNIKRYLQNCLRHHASCDQQKEISNSRLSRLRLIDCSTRSIVTHPAENPYVALSYRWGESHTDLSVQQTDMLPTQLPATIEDAIQVTRSLGFKYLWIDKYCVLQTDGYDFKHQIRQMHLIYRSAQITIIAGGSMDASSGLVGVSTPRANMQTKGRYKDLKLITFSSWPWACVTHTEGWIERAWTFQEGYFSQRRLAFTDKQVLFDCDEGVVSEDLQHSQIQYVLTLQKWQPNIDGMDVYNLVEKYTQRVLTYDDDILNAFDGILADLEQRKPSIRSHWGIPLLFDGSRYLLGLLIGLCWHHMIQNENIHRRLGFPSWSWAGWSYDPFADYTLRREPDTRIVVADGLRVQTEKQNGLAEAWKTFEDAIPETTQRHHYSQRIHVSAPSLKVKLHKRSRCFSWVGPDIEGHGASVVRSEKDGCWSEAAYLDSPFEDLEFSPDAYGLKDTRICHVICLFSADKMTDLWADTIVYNIFAMLLVSKVGMNWERVGLWTPSFESEEEAEVFEQWLQSSPTYKTRDFWVA